MTRLSFVLVALALTACHEPSAPEGGFHARVSALANKVDLAVISTSMAPRVLPGGVLTAVVTVTNTGTTTWKAGTVVLAFQGDAAFNGGTLVTHSAVGPNATANFTGTLSAPTQVGRFALAWRAVRSGTAFGPTISGTTEVTCSDSAFCNGAEAYVNGACAAGLPPCNDGEECTADGCDEATDMCSHLVAAECAQCFAPNCTPHCFKHECGDDGCGGSCGSCPTGLGCIDGTCAAVESEGSCGNALLLAASDSLPGTHTLTGDTSAGVNEVVPRCNDTSEAPELIYTFTTPDYTIGLDARSSGYDTVLHLRRTTCQDESSTVACADDSSPPGDFGSRIQAMLDANTTYYLIVDGFDGSQFGPFTATATFVRGCVPQCDGKYCGDDGCGGACGACAEGEFCASDARCKPSPCTPDCRGRQCGDDGCGGSCGDCKDGRLCVTATGACKAFLACDHERPACKTACSSNEYCGTDCECHRLRDPLPDLIVDARRLQEDIVFDWLEVGVNSCAVAEACVGGTGLRRLLRFSVEATNQGQVDLTVPPPATRPDLFHHSACHGHYHFEGFASYALLDLEGNVVLTGHKQAYCMEDTVRAFDGPGVACDKKYDCENQGIQAGWSDIYGNALDCQWLDITDLPAGEYLLTVLLNPGRAFQEESFDNNTSTVRVTIPAE